MKEIDRFSKIKRNTPRGNHKIGFGDSFLDTKDLAPAFSCLFESLSDVEWAVREATSDGPNHRQLRNALILKQLATLIKQFKLTEGVEIRAITGTSPKEYNFDYPIGIPKDVLNFITENMDEAQNWLGEGPFHEVAFDLLLMNCLSAVNKKVEKLLATNEISLDGNK